MRLDIEDNHHVGTVIEPRPLPEVRDLPFEPASPGFGWLRHYIRPAGVIQVLYAAFFGWLAFVEFGTGQFYTPALVFKGDHPEFYDYQWLITTTLCTLLAFTSLIGGYGLLGRRPWVRRWEVAYLGFVAVGVAAQTVWIQSDVPGYPSFFARSRPADFTALILFSLMFALPFVPCLFGVVSRRAGATILRAPAKKKPLSSFDGVSDQELDG